MRGRQLGYAVIDVETTGLRPSWHDRVIEVAVVLLDPLGRITGEWCTLVNPERDLGAQGIHGIRAADVRHAPSFKDVAASLIEMLRGRVPVAHNLRFDAGFLEYEFARADMPIPALGPSGVCTMTEALRFLPAAPRTLAGCCAVADVPLDDHHNALADAHAATDLLRHYLALAHPDSPWAASLKAAAELTWPTASCSTAAPVRRGVSAERDGHFLARILDRMPRGTGTVQADPYLALLDQVLLDHHIAATEADLLIALAAQLDLSRAEATSLHREYLSGLAAAAKADGVVTVEERQELDSVAVLLGLALTAVEEALAAAAPRRHLAATGGFRLQSGDLVVFTGEMDDGREAWEERARRAGLIAHPNVTKRVRLLVAADPDTMSGKARKARAYGIPIVTPGAFARMIAEPTLSS
ncbi:exonuclease domain-containing protein [Spongiactinospora sp. TRM90649]|uniref:exonuclease domain-containing protein n=1 Tax=Spongiactinospora sp. TRM90649 TaxID=3031114 RepID=UPI0023F7A474|nr:exonuclease domain-containing protein [Spongiactinospora sp. TRM90649]MDF5759276.1 exonuclease domain-containing protein [Spongiactinospora sp. TRM90649]